MTYREAVAWLYSTQLFGIKLGLENMRRLWALLETDPKRERAIFHVAGTNGKGSVCAMIEAMLRAREMRVGLYTSPHLVTFRERIRVDGEMIPEDAVAAGLTLIRERIQKWDPSPTFFEITTALALWWFQAKGAAAVVLETGLGGRLDATNIVTPSVVVISTIALDHEKYLGATIEAIAREKAGIFKRAVPIISLPQEPGVQTIIEDAAREVDAPLTFVTEPWSASPIGLPGSHQKWNAAAAMLAVRTVISGESSSAETDSKALRDVQWPGRFQRVDQRFVLDGGHNPAAAQRLAETWREEFGDEQATLVLGVMRDKDLRGVCAALLPIATRVFTVAVQNARAASAGELGKLIRELNVAIDCREFPTLADALGATGEYAERTLVAGSLFLVGEAMVALGLAESDEAASVQ